jgi:hypothetical protein
MKEEKLSKILIPKDEQSTHLNSLMHSEAHQPPKREINDFLNFKNAFMCSLAFLGLYTAIYSA